MSFLIKKEIKVNQVDDDTGAVYGTSIQNVELLVTITSVKLNADKSAIAFFQYGDDPNATGYTSFTYEGGDLLDVGESAAKSFFGDENSGAVLHESITED